MEKDYINKLILSAMDSCEKAYSPYSKFKVGAAILTDDFKIYEGFNIECAAYSICNCAERTALFRAVYDGHKHFKAIAVVGKRDIDDSFSEYCPPCGMCRQALREFCNPKTFKIILQSTNSLFFDFTSEKFRKKSKVSFN